MALLDIAGLDFAYGDTQVLWNLNLAVSAGQMVALVGANGAGKTTLIRLISGLAPPIAGRIHFLDADPAGVGAEALRKCPRDGVCSPLCPWRKT